MVLGVWGFEKGNKDMPSDRKISRESASWTLAQTASRDFKTCHAVCSKLLPTK